MKLMYLLKCIFYTIVLSGFSAAHADAYVDFFRAVNVDDVRTVNDLLSRGFDPNAPNTKGQPALVQALRDDSPKVAAALLAHPGIKVDGTTAAGETPLMMAAILGKLDWMQKLLDRGAQIERQGWTPLHYAASGPEPKAVALLLDRGAAIDAPSPNRSTPVMMAARYGSEDAALLLVARGANLALRNDQGLGAVDFARAAGRDSLAKRLETPAR
jgi:ankyrin repeat protein